jgi:hypothetical protein
MDGMASELDTELVEGSKWESQARRETSGTRKSSHHPDTGNGVRIGPADAWRGTSLRRLLSRSSWADEGEEHRSAARPECQ